MRRSDWYGLGLLLVLLLVAYAAVTAILIGVLT